MKINHIYYDTMCSFIVGSTLITPRTSTIISSTSDGIINPGGGGRGGKKRLYGLPGWILWGLRESKRSNPEANRQLDLSSSCTSRKFRDNNQYLIKFLEGHWLFSIYFIEKSFTTFSNVMANITVAIMLQGHKKLFCRNYLSSKN